MADLSDKAGFGKGPVGNVAVGRDAVKGERAKPRALPSGPPHRRNRVHVLARSRSRLVERPSVWLAHVHHQHAAVVQPQRQQVGVVRVEVQAHHPCMTSRQRSGVRSTEWHAGMHLARPAVEVLMEGHHEHCMR